MHQSNVHHQAVSEAQTLQRIRDLVKLALVADQHTKVLLMRDVQSIIEKHRQRSSAGQLRNATAVHSPDVQ